MYSVIRIYVMKETQNTEFKESWRDEYIKYVSGFANAQGGLSMSASMTRVRLWA